MFHRTKHVIIRKSLSGVGLRIPVFHVCFDRPCNMLSSVVVLKNYFFRASARVLEVFLSKFDLNALFSVNTEHPCWFPT